MLEDIVNFIKSYDGINDKNKLAQLVQSHFSCVKDGSVYYTQDFSIRFCKAKSEKFSNGILSLSKLQKYDQNPFLVCVCMPEINLLLIANTTFINKISHSSQELRVDNIRGTFLGSNIIRDIDGILNSPENFNLLFDIHKEFTFEENLKRLVEATREIIPTGIKYQIDQNDLVNILSSPNRAIDFSESPEYKDLLSDLDNRTMEFENCILVAACIENVNLRGRIIEYLIAGEDHKTREQLINYLTDKNSFPEFHTDDGLGDYSKEYDHFFTKTDIKTKIMVLNSAPKGYNVDKMLRFLSQPRSVFMLYLIGINFEQKSISTKLISMFQDTLVSNTIVQKHWAGRNSRGVTQFRGEAIKRIIIEENNTIDLNTAKKFIDKLLSL